MRRRATAKKMGLAHWEEKWEEPVPPSRKTFSDFEDSLGLLLLLGIPVLQLQLVSGSGIMVGSRKTSSPIHTGFFALSEYYLKYSAYSANISWVKAVAPPSLSSFGAPSLTTPQFWPKHSAATASPTSILPLRIWAHMFCTALRPPQRDFGITVVGAVGENLAASTLRRRSAYALGFDVWRNMLVNKRKDEGW